MSDRENLEEHAFLAALAAHSAAIGAATGSLAVDNVPTDVLRLVAESTNDIVRLAARVVLYQRSRL